MAVPIGRLPRGGTTPNVTGIVNIATRRAGNTQLGANTLTAGADAQTWLNTILFDLYSQYNWPFLNTTAALVLTGATFSLPSDFSKSADDYALEYVTINGQQTPGFILEVDRGTFEATKAGQTGGDIAQNFGQPQIWTADRNANLGYLFPDPTGSTISATLRYQQLPPDIDVTTNGDTIIPVFPYSNMLVQALYVQCLEFEFDPRVDTERVRFEKMLEGVRQAAQPLRSTTPDIPLDVALFGTPFRSD